MGFERTKGSITNLGGTEVSVDALLDMLVCVTRDVYENNEITNVSSMKVEDQSVMLKKLYNLLKVLLTVYGDNQAGIFQFGERIRGDYLRIAEALKESEAVIDDLVKEMAHCINHRDFVYGNQCDPVFISDYLTEFFVRYRVFAS